MGKKNFLLPALFILLFGCAFASTVSRSFSATTVGLGDNLAVTLTVDVTGGETFYAIDEAVPIGWTVKNAGTGSTEHSGHLKWVVTEGAADTAYTYVLAAPSQSGTATFSGIYMFEGMESETAIAEQTLVTVAAVCAIADDCQGSQLCCGNRCIAPACSADSDCASGRVCINRGACNAACVTTGCTASNPCPSGQTCCNRVCCPAGQICCGSNCVTPACSSDAGCNDNDGKTADKCNNAGDCTAVCTHEPIVVKPPAVIFKRGIEAGEMQTITLAADDGTPIMDFNVLMTFPDKTTVKFIAQNGSVAIPIGSVGTYNATVQTAGHEVQFSFEAKAPLPPIIPPETKESPNYMFIWLMAIIVISGLLMAITRLKPLWFRVFMAGSYTALPFAVRYYLQSMELAFAVIAVQTTLLTALWFWQWKKEKSGQLQEKKEWKQAGKEKPVEREPPQPSAEERSEKVWDELQRELERIRLEKEALPAEGEKSGDASEWEEFLR